MQYILKKDYVYYKGEVNETLLKKGTIVDYHGNYSINKCWVRFNKSRYLVDRKDLIIKQK